MILKTPCNLLVTAGMALAIGFVLCACGRKGNIDPPSTPAELRNKRTKSGAALKPANVDRSFILDKLL